MGVAAHDWNCMLPAKSRDPQVIGRNRLTRVLQFQPDGRVVPRGLNANIKDCASVQHSLQGFFVSLAVAGLRDSKSKLPGYHYGDRKLARLGHNLNCFRRSVQISGKGISVQNQVQSSGSICSNSSSMIFCIRNVSPWRWASSPAHSSQGLPGRRLPWESFSSTACVTYSRKGIPNALAVALALRKVGSGISSVVFTAPVSHIYGTAARRDSSARDGRVRVFHGGLLSNGQFQTRTPTRSNEINLIAEIWNKNNWLPTLDDFRTLALRP